MASRITIKKRVLIDFLFLVKDKTGDLKEYREKMNKLPLFDIQHMIAGLIANYDIKWLVFNLGVAFSWFINDCNNDEANCSVAVLDELYDIFGIIDPDDEEEEDERDQIGTDSETDS